MTEITNRNQVRAAIAAGGWTIAWGDLINEWDLLTFIISVPTGTTLGWVEEQARVQIAKFREGFKDHNKSGETEFNGLGVKAGFATYNRWMDFGIGKTKLANNHQPYIGVRVVKPGLKAGKTIPPARTPEGLDPHSWYKMCNEGKLKDEAGQPIALDVVNDGNQLRDGKIQMAVAGDFSGQYWQFWPSSVIPGTYNIRNLWLGPGMALDVYGDDKTLPHLAVAGWFSGQQWHVQIDNNKNATLTNEFSSMLVLSTDFAGAGLHMKDPSGANESRWVLQKWRPITESGFGI